MFTSKIYVEVAEATFVKTLFTKDFFTILKI